MPVALSILWNLIRDKDAPNKIETIKEFDKILGLNLLKKDKLILSKKIEELVKEREDARKNKDWQKSDDLREKIKKLGFWIEDTGKGSKIKKI
jgi:cysteinyl-tRNA synthetase